MKNGFGKLYFPDGSAYSGYFKNGVARDMEDYCIQMVMYMSENGKMTRHMEMARITQLMAAVMKATGSLT